MALRLAVRLDDADQLNLEAIGAAMAAEQEPNAAPWSRGVTMTECMKRALAVAAAAAATVRPVSTAGNDPRG